LLPARKLTPIDPAVQYALQERVDYLESLVRSLAPEQQKVTSSPSAPIPTTTTTIHDPDPLLRGFGRISLEDDESSYTESDHWTAILDEISDFQNVLKDHKESENLQYPEGNRLHPGLGLFLFQYYPATDVDIISALPPRSIVDGIIAKYFSSADMPVTLIIHRNVFFRRYENFWERPFETPIMWITILFGMMYTVAYYTLFVTGDLGSLDGATLSEYQNIVETSHEKMIQCLRLGNYMKGAPHTVEALLYLLQVEYIQGDGAQYGCWQLIGVIVRIAMKMGYHRDGSHFPKMPPYEAEMRRRTWYIASAAQAGLPRIIKEAQCDTAEPRSLLDDDFDESTITLPQGRPPTEHTLAQFLIHKSRVISIYGMICDFTTSYKQRDYDEAMRFDAMLNSAYAQKPAILEPKPIQRSILDGTHLITRRLYIAMSYHHAQMTLHRRYMILAKTNNRYIYSHATCIDAAISTLQYQIDLFDHCQPGRMLYSDRWKILSLTQSEFLHATIILCLNLDDDLTHARWQHSPLFSESGFNKHLEVLRSSKATWSQQQGFSKEAQTAVKAIDRILDKAKKAAGGATPSLKSAFTNGTGSSTVAALCDSGIRGSITYENLIASNLGSKVLPTNDFCDPSLDPLVLQCQPLRSDALLEDPRTTLDEHAWDQFSDLDQLWNTWIEM
jgi:hypothetical protein